MQVKDNSRPGRFDVTTDGRGVTGRAGLGLAAEVADTIGLTGALSAVTSHARSWAVHEPGKVLRDLVLTLADGGDALRHMAVLDGQSELFGVVASPATVCRTVVAVADDEQARGGIAAARRAARSFVWDHGGAPPVVAAARETGQTPDEPLAVDLDATIIIAHSDDKDGAGATYKRTWGHHPLVAYLDRGDGLGESLAGLLRPGNAGANDADDHVTVFDTALAQLPELPEQVPLLVRADTAGATHDFLDHVRGHEDHQVFFSVGFPLDPDVKDAIRAVPDESWEQATTQQGEIRKGAHVAEITDQIPLGQRGWPDGCRLIVRREPLHPGAQQTLDDIDGCRFTAFLTDQPDGDLAVLDTRHRGHARVEDRIRGAKDTGARTLPCDTFDRNALWLELVLTAQDLMVHTQTIGFPDHDELRLAEPQQLRYKLLHTPARIVHHARRVIVRIQHDWPWAQPLAVAFQRVRALPIAPAP